ncbi:MAG: transcriptional repressor LexA [Ardenticatenaceae bacterium]|nr:transcriptional repressor LexA [Anaerolineales bacterium]MCB8940653.1 transcriptional repressor LexA [Ardenticatenaceae bacterium]MCB8971983.1 transcriptional repressor LexA [Ardenticatenaceae bacterium]
MAKKALSERQKNILAYIQEYVAEFGRPPTIREIGGAVNISSTSVVNYNLTKLKERGLLERDSDVSRGLRLTEKVAETTGKAVAAVGKVVEEVNTAVSNLLRVPLVGNIVAGSPIEGVNGDFSVYDDEDAIELSSSMIPGRKDDLFALRVSGDSMIDAMVNDGDIVIMRPEYNVRDGDMVAVWLRDDTTTLKYFFQEGKKVRLQPANPTMDPIYVDRKDVQVQGKVMMVLRQTA